MWLATIGNLKMIIKWFFGFILYCSLQGFCNGREIFLSPLGRNSLNCTTMHNPCLTIQYVIDHVAAPHDIVKIDGSHGDFTIEREVQLSKCTVITFTSYNGVALIYRVRKQSEVVMFDSFLLVRWLERIAKCTITINTINFLDTTLFISQRLSFIQRHISTTLTVRNCHFEFSASFSIQYDDLILMNSHYSLITLEKCTIKANCQIGILTRYYPSTKIILKNSRIEDARYTVYSRIQQCTVEKCFNLTIVNSLLASNGKCQSTNPQVQLHAAIEVLGKVWFSISLENSRFENITALAQTAAVLDIPGPSEIFIRNCIFKGNIGNRGGAISLKSTITNILHSQFHENQARLYTICGLENQGGCGGAILFEGTSWPVMINIYNSSFINNMATCFGSAVYLGHLETIIVKQTKFISSFTRLSDTIWLSYSKNLQIDKVSLEARKESNTDGGLFFARSTNFTFGDRMPYFKCPIGSIINTSESSPIISMFGKYRSREVKCHYCAKSKYTLTPSTISGFNGTKNEYNRIQPHCQSCSFGAVCNLGIKPKPNFWGYAHKSKAFMIVCPPGYCCQTPSQCMALSSCNDKRTGRLCGKCKHGYFQSVFTKDCLEERFCKVEKFWTVAIVMCLLFTIIFIFLQDIFLLIVSILSMGNIVSVIKRRIDGLKKNVLHLKQSIDDERRHRDPINDELNEDTEDYEVAVNDMVVDGSKHEAKDNTIAGGLIKIIFFFYQVHSLLTVYKSNKENQHIRQLKGLIFSVFNVNALVPLGNEFHCPFHGVGSTTKVWIKALFPLNSLIFAAFLYVCFYALSQCFGANGCNQQYSRKVIPRFLTGILQLILLGYSTLASSILSLLTCLSLVSGEKILYIDGNIPCYQTWQYAILLFIVLWAIPLIHALHKLPSYMRKGGISIQGIYVALLLPLPFAAYTMVRGVRKRKRSEMFDSSNDEHMTTSIGYVQMPQTNTIMTKLLNVVEGPFRYKTSGTKGEKLSWEPILLLQRLLLSLCHTFVLEPGMRSLFLLLFIIVFAIINALYRPYSSFFLNATSIFIFFLLCITGIINVVYALIYEYGIIPKGPLVQLLSIFDHLELLMVMIFPAIAAATLVILAIVKIAAFVGSLVQFIIENCKRCKSNGD